MRCERIRDLFPDEWAGTLDAGTRAQFDAHIEGCGACRQELDTLRSLWTSLSRFPSEEPGAGVRPRFYAMLEGYQQGLGEARTGEPKRRAFTEWLDSWNLRRPALQFGLASLLLAAGFFGGYLLSPPHGSRDELTSLREEVHEMRRMVTISLLKQQSASERLKGVSWSNQINHPDPEFLNTLLYTLDHDPSVDVRLASVDALARFAGDQAVRQGLVQSLRRQDSPMVQISLIDLLVQLHERQSIDTFKQLANDNTQNQVVRQRAEWGLQLLS